MSRRTSPRRSRAGATMVALLSLAPVGCMLITSPGDFSIVDGSTQSTMTTKHDANASDGSADGGACSSVAGESMCGACVATSCCQSYNDCENDTACVALLDCATDDTSCENDNKAGQSHAKALTDCLSKSCAICSEAGIGDPCGSDGETCAAGLTCTGLWCTKSCAGDSDCAGAFAGGENASGGQNRCVINEENAAVCFPGCATTADCASFAGTTCVMAEASISGTTDVCAATGVSDGGLDGEVDATDDGEIEEDAFVDAGTDSGTDATMHSPEGGGSDATGG